MGYLIRYVCRLSKGSTRRQSNFTLFNANSVRMYCADCEFHQLHTSGFNTSIAQIRWLAWTHLKVLLSLTTTLSTRGQGTSTAGHWYRCPQRSTLCGIRLPQRRWSRLYPLRVWEGQGQAPPLWCRLHDQNFHRKKTAELASWSFRPHHVPKIPNPGQQVCHCLQCLSTYCAGWNWRKGGLLLRLA